MSLLKEAQRMQTRVEEQQNRLNRIVVEKTGDGGGVSVKVNGKFRGIDIRIRKDVAQNADGCLIADMVMAFNSALDDAEAETGVKMNKMTDSVRSQLKLD